MEHNLGAEDLRCLRSYSHIRIFTHCTLKIQTCSYLGVEKDLGGFVDSKNRPMQSRGGCGNNF